eukprot:1223448-Pleurochrysis_carterae.AAC.3
MAWKNQIPNPNSARIAYGPEHPQSHSVFLVKESAGKVHKESVSSQREHSSLLRDGAHKGAESAEHTCFVRSASPSDIGSRDQFSFSKASKVCRPT